MNSHTEVDLQTDEDCSFQLVFEILPHHSNITFAAKMVFLFLTNTGACLPKKNTKQGKKAFSVPGAKAKYSINTKNQFGFLIMEIEKAID